MCFCTTAPIYAFRKNKFLTKTSQCFCRITKQDAVKELSISQRIWERIIYADMICDPYKDITVALVFVWLTRSWIKLNARTISRCFLKCGFRMNEPPSNASNVVVVEGPEADLQQQESSDDNIFPPPLTADVFMDQAELAVLSQKKTSSNAMNVHNDTTAIPTGAHAGAEDNELSIPSIPSSAQASDAIQTLLLYGMSRGECVKRSSLTSSSLLQWNISTF